MIKLWNDKEYLFPTTDNISILTEQILDKYTNLFWKEIVSKISDNQHILLLIRVRFKDNQIRTLSELQTIIPSSKDNLLQFIKDRLYILNEAYQVIPVSSLIFSYGIREGGIIPAIGPSLRQQTPNTKYQIYYRNELPIAMIPENYGLILSKIDNNYTISVQRGKHNALIILTVKTENKLTVNHIRYIKNNNLLFSWTDTFVSIQFHNYKLI